MAETKGKTKTLLDDGEDDAPKLAPEKKYVHAWCERALEAGSWS